MFIGGGARGVIPAVFLNEIAKATGKRIHELFNCIGGKVLSLSIFYKEHP